jgi:hypothetical protein
MSELEQKVDQVDTTDQVVDQVVEQKVDTTDQVVDKVVEQKVDTTDQVVDQVVEQKVDTTDQVVDKVDPIEQSSKLVKKIVNYFIKLSKNKVVDIKLIVKLVKDATKLVKHLESDEATVVVIKCIKIFIDKHTNLTELETNALHAALESLQFLIEHQLSKSSLKCC